jgi:hypothetical protein
MMGQSKCVTVGIAILIAVVSLPRAVRAQSNSPSSISVRVIDDAGVDRGVLKKAQRLASGIYARAGIDLSWSASADTPIDGVFMIHIVRKSLGGETSNDRVLGVAPRALHQRARHAWVFYERILDYSAALGLSITGLLAGVMTHELGHLLLDPTSSHGIGVMQESWGAPQVSALMIGRVAFTPEEAATMRLHVRAASAEAVDISASR